MFKRLLRLRAVVGLALFLVPVLVWPRPGWLDRSLSLVGHGWQGEGVQVLWFLAVSCGLCGVALYVRRRDSGVPLEPTTENRRTDQPHCRRA